MNPRYLLLLPLALGLYLRLTGCWGDRRSMLGTGILVATAVAYAYWSERGSP